MADKPTQSEKKLLQAACAHHKGETPDTLLSFKVYPTKVAIIISTGQKYEYSLGELGKALVKKIKGEPEVEIK
jgi:hypothetical protein